MRHCLRVLNCMTRSLQPTATRIPIKPISSRMISSEYCKSRRVYAGVFHACRNSILRHLDSLSTQWAPTLISTARCIPTLLPEEQYIVPADFIYGIDPLDATQLETKSTMDTQPISPPTTEPPIYKYQALPTKDHIRRLILAPGTSDDALQGDLETISLQDPLNPYEAISYVWGSEKKDHVITIAGGSTIHITTNLAQVLRQARLPHAPRALWADSV